MLGSLSVTKSILPGVQAKYTTSVSACTNRFVQTSSTFCYVFDYSTADKEPTLIASITGKKKQIIIGAAISSSTPDVVAISFLNPCQVCVYSLNLPYKTPKGLFQLNLNPDDYSYDYVRVLAFHETKNYLYLGTQNGRVLHINTDQYLRKDKKHERSAHIIFSTDGAITSLCVDKTTFGAVVGTASCKAIFIAPESEFYEHAGNMKKLAEHKKMFPSVDKEFWNSVVLLKEGDDERNHCPPDDSYPVVSSVAIDPVSNGMVVVATSAGTLYLYDMYAAARDAASSITSVSVSPLTSFRRGPSGQTSICFSVGEVGCFYVCDVSVGVIRKYTPSSPSPLSLAKLADCGIFSCICVCGNRMLLCCIDGRIRIIDMVSTVCVHEGNPAHTHPPLAFTSLESGEHLFSCGMDGTVRQWSHSLENTHSMFLHGSGKASGGRVVSGMLPPSMNSHATCMAVSSGERVQGKTSGVHRDTVSGMMVVGKGNGEVLLYDLQTKHVMGLIGQMKGSCVSVDINKKTIHLVAVSDNTGEVSIFRIKEHTGVVLGSDVKLENIGISVKPVPKIEFKNISTMNDTISSQYGYSFREMPSPPSEVGSVDPSNVTYAGLCHLSFSSCGGWLFLSSGPFVKAVNCDGWKSETLKSNIGELYCLAAHPRGKIFAVGGRRGVSIYVINDSNHLVRIHTFAMTSTATCIYFHPHFDCVLLSGDENGVVSVLDVKEKRPIVRTQVHKSIVIGITVLSDSPYSLYTASTDGVILRLSMQGIRGISNALRLGCYDFLDSLHCFLYGKDKDGKKVDLFGGSKDSVFSPETIMSTLGIVEEDKKLIDHLIEGSTTLGAASVPTESLPWLPHFVIPHPNICDRLFKYVSGSKSKGSPSSHASSDGSMINIDAIFCQLLQFISPATQPLANNAFSPFVESGEIVKHSHARVLAVDLARKIVENKKKKRLKLVQGEKESLARMSIDRQSPLR
ncbi:hypothetical protein ADUPG1_009582, partial [Aduncisulcus paluster]